MTYSVPVMSATGSNTSGQSVTLYRTGIGTVTAYTATVTVTDSVGNSSSRSIYVPTVEIPFVIDPTLPAVGVGAVPQTARTLELASNWFLNAGAGVIIASTVDVLADALTMTGSAIRGFYGAGASYTGDLPESNYGYGAFLAIRRAGNSIFVLAIPNLPSLGLALNRYDGSSWTGWERQATIGMFGQRVLTGSVSSVYGQQNTVITTSLPGGYSYLLLAAVDANAGGTSNTSIMSAGLLVTSGSYSSGHSKEVRTTQQSGGGLTVQMYIKTTTDCTVVLRSYGYSNKTYTLRGLLNIIRFPPMATF